MATKVLLPGEQEITIERRDENGLRICRSLLTDIGKKLSCRVKLTKEHKIGGFKVKELGKGEIHERDETP